LPKVGAESSDAWNNAGTGHSAFCELNYTPEREDGSIDISKALRIANSFEISKQFWTYLNEQKLFPSQQSFINDIPHMSFVWGAENMAFLKKKRYKTMTEYAIFEDMKYTDDHDKITEWVPLMMRNRVHEHPIAVTRMDIGTDVNFGAISRGMIVYLKILDGGRSSSRA
jgi:malate dehydrogenase (quinone)